jgi:hypothetical protein
VGKRRGPFGWSRPQWVTFAVGGVIVFAVVPLLTWYLGWSATGIGSAVVWAAGIVLLFYALETQAMRQEMAAANKMAVQPLLVTTIENPEHGARAVFVVMNIGKGPALRVRFADVDFLKGDSLKGTPFRLAGRFYTADCLAAGEKQPVTGVFGVEENGRFQGDDWIAALNPRIARENYRITITYEDMNGGEHKSVMQMGVDGAKLLSLAE